VEEEDVMVVGVGVGGRGEEGQKLKEGGVL
jgi:hypothetical protein